jgi:non-specific serine/threonine protein kinase
MAYAQGDSSAAEEHWREALDLSRREGDKLAEGNAWTGMGLIEMGRLDYGSAESYMQKALTLAEPLAEEWLASLLRVFLGTTLLLQGESERAERMFEEALASARRLNTPSIIYPALYNSAQLALARSDLEKAARMFREGIEWAGRTKDRAYLAHFMEALAAVASSRSEAERSAVLIGAAEGLLEGVGGRVHNYFVPDPSLQERAVTEAHAALGDTAFEEAREHGRAMTFDQTVEYALGTDEVSTTPTA